MRCDHVLLNLRYEADCYGYLNVRDCRPDVGGRIHFEAKLALEDRIHQVTQRLGRTSWIKQLPLVVPLGFEESITDKLQCCQVPEKIFARDISLNIYYFFKKNIFQMQFQVVLIN